MAPRKNVKLRPCLRCNRKFKTVPEIRICAKCYHYKYDVKRKMHIETEHPENNELEEYKCTLESDILENLDNIIQTNILTQKE